MLSKEVKSPVAEASAPVEKKPRTDSQHIRKTVLGNGIVVVTETMEGIASASLGLWMDKGSRDETVQGGGISHFFEHMVFKGTAKRSAFELVNTLECKGGQINAFTSKEQICLYARVVGEEVTTALDVLLDMIAEPSFPEGEITKEREVVIEEIKGADDNPDERVYDLFSNALFGTQGPGLPITGTETSVRSLGKLQLVEHLREIQQLKPLVVTAVGRIDHGQVCEVITRLTDSAAFRGTRQARPRQDIRYTYGHLAENMDVQQVLFHLGTPAYDFYDPRCYALAALNCILGDGMSSILFQELREKYGYVYQINTFTEYMADCGFFGISFNTEPKYLSAVIAELGRILREVREQGISQSQLDFAKAYIQGNYHLEQESTQSRMSYLARMVLQEEQDLSREQYLAHYRRLTLDDVNQVACEVLDSSRWASASILPEKMKFDVSKALDF